MNEKTGFISTNGTYGAPAELDPASYLAQEYRRWETLFADQPPVVQRYLEAQARLLAEALVQNASQVTFHLPDQVSSPFETSSGGSRKMLAVPPDLRAQLIGGLLERLTRTSLNTALRQRLDELEASSNPAILASAGLVRFATATFLVSGMLPAGRQVEYHALDGEEIPSVPQQSPGEAGSAITAETDAIVEAEEGSPEAGRGPLQVPFVPAARRFYLPQWVAFDEQDRLLTGTLSEAEARIASMQRFLRVLHSAVALAPYMVTDETYRRKRYGMLGQLVNQGRALARYETGQIIQTIKQRAAANDLNRGLSLSLPFFDDQDLEIKTYDFQVIPAGRIMFIPAFVVRASRQEQVKVAQDTRLNPSTRKHLLLELQTLEAAFEPSLP